MICYCQVNFICKVLPAIIVIIIVIIISLLTSDFIIGFTDKNRRNKKSNIDSSHEYSLTDYIVGFDRFISQEFPSFSDAILIWPHLSCSVWIKTLHVSNVSFSNYLVIIYQ